MKRLLQLLSLLCLGVLTLTAGEKANTVLLHPGETVYAEFARKGIKLTLVKASKEKNDRAQIILTLDPVSKAKSGLINFQIENKFPLDLDYQAQIRSFTQDVRTMVAVYPVVGEKLSYFGLPSKVEEVALFGWVLEK